MSAEAVRTLKFRVIYEDQATAPSKAFHSAERARIKETAKEQEKSDAAFIRATKLKLRAEKELADEILRRIKEREKAEADEERSYIRAVRAKLRAEADLEREKELAARHAEREAQKEERAYVRAVQKQLAAQREVEEQSRRNAEAQAQQTIGVVKMVAAWAGLQSVGSVVMNLVSHIDHMRVAAMEAAEALAKAGAAYGSLAAAEGHMGKPTLSMAGMMRFRAQTLQTPEAATSMMTAAMASAFPMIQAGAVDKKDFDEFMVTAGKLQTMLPNESPEAFGKVAGNLPMMLYKEGGPKLTTQQMNNFLGKMYKVQQLSGFERVEQTAGAMNAGMPMMGAGLYTPEEWMAGVGTMAFGGNAGNAATMMEQASRAVSSGLMRARHMKTDKEHMAQMVTSADYFKGLGVTDQMATLKRIETVGADINKQEDIAKAAGKRFDALVYLGAHGIINQEDQIALMHFAGTMRKKNVYASLKAAAMGAAPEGGIAKDFEAGVAADPAMQMRQIEVEEEAEKTEETQKHYFKEMAQRRAYVALGGEKYFGQGETYKTVMERAVYNPTEMFWGNRRQVEWKAQEMVLEDARRRGIEVPNVNRIDAKTGEVTGKDWLGWEALEEIGRKTQAAGAPSPIPGGDQHRLTSAMERVADGLERMVGKAEAPPLNNAMPMPGPGARQ